MQTIILLLNPGRLENPDLDLSYCVPDCIEEASKGKIQSNGYDFIDTEDKRPGPLMGIWLETENAKDNWPLVKKVLETQKFKGNDLSLSVEIYISELDTDALENCTLVYPESRTD